MPKHIDNVIIPDRKRSIRNIPIPEDRRRPEPPSDLNGVKKVPPRPSLGDSYPPPPPPPRPRRSFSSRRTWVSALIGIVVLGFASLSFFGGATLSYEPRSSLVEFEGETFTANKTGETGLLYSVVKLSGDKGVSVPASGEKAVSRKASGTIIVYNDASAEPQRLVENTRFESTSGKVYRIAQAISIPGKKNSGPGSIEVTVYADVAGADYNIDLTDFTLPGLRGTPRYETIYARSKTPMAGGFVGQEKSVSEEALRTAETDLRSNLTAELLTRAQAEVPEDFVLIPSLSSVQLEPLPQSPSDEAGSVMVNMRGNLYGVMFKRSELAAFLSLQKAPVAVGDPVVFESLEPLTFSMVGEAPLDLLSRDQIDFSVTGSTRLVWKTDEVALQTALAGRDQSELSQILQNFPTVEKAEAHIRPFWKSSFPDESGEIVVKVLPLE